MRDGGGGGGETQTEEQEKTGRRKRGTWTQQNGRFREEGAKGGKGHRGHTKTLRRSCGKTRLTEAR